MTRNTTIITSMILAMFVVGMTSVAFVNAESESIDVSPDNWKTIKNGGSGWYKSQSNVFTTSYNWGTASQTLEIPTDLKQALSNNMFAEITLSEQYSKKYCGDEKLKKYANSPPTDRYYLTLRVLDDSSNVLSEKSTGIITVPGSCNYDRNWTDAQVAIYAAEVSNVSSATKIQIEHGGISGEYWKGHYGTSMRDAEITWSDQSPLLIDEGVISTAATDILLQVDAQSEIVSKSAYGYGVLFNTGDLLVATTHGGVLDSELQENADDSVWHNHIVRLTDSNALCGDNLAVVDLTNKSPGDIMVYRDRLLIDRAPLDQNFDGNFGQTDLHIDSSVQPVNVVSFTINPVDENGETNLSFDAVCIENVKATAVANSTETITRILTATQ